MANKKLMEENIKNYASQIETIDDFVEVVRKMPGMYIGSRGNKGFLNMVREIFQNSVDELEKEASPCTWINVIYDERTHTTTVEDNGRGIPFDAMIRIYTSQHTSSNYTKKEGEFSSGLHGVGSKVTNALSQWFTVESYILGEARRVEFIEGKPKSEPKVIPNKNNKQGTIVSFRPSYETMGDITLTVDDVLGLVLLILPLTKIGSVINFKGIYSDGKEIVQNMTNTDGILTNLIMKTTNPVIKPIMISRYTGIMTADIAFTYDSNDLMVESITAFSNFCPTIEGTHVDGFLDGICHYFRNYMNKVYLASNKKNKLQITNSDIKTGLKAIVAVKHLNPVFTGQAKEILSNEDMQPFVKETVIQSLEQWAKENPKDLQKLCKYYKEVAEIRAKSEEGKVKLSSKYESSSLSAGMPKKYTKPSGKKNLELIICEGDSAAGSAKNSRCRERQGLFPIRGKMPNAFTTERSKFLSNEEVAAIITIVGGGYGRSFDISKVKWEKVIFTCFTGDTKVKMLDGTIKTFEELVELENLNPGRDYWVYSYDTENNKMVPAIAKAPRVTKYINQLALVTLNNGHTIKCTPEHLFLTKDRGYVPASCLLEGESLKSLYTKLNDEVLMNEGREMYYDENTFKWIFTHKETVKYANNLFVPAVDKGLHVHHIDHNCLNNEPTNLVYLDKHTHYSHYAKESKLVVEYNGSEKHIEDVKRAHLEGKYEHTYFRNNGYNGSEKHLEDVRRAHAEGRCSYEWLMNYNKSEANKESTIKLNQNPEVKVLQQRGKCIKSGTTLIKDGYILSEELLSNNRNELKAKGYTVSSLNNISNLFESFEDYVQECYNHLPLLTEDEYVRYSGKVENNRTEGSYKTKKTMIVKVIKTMEIEGLEFTEENYNLTKLKVASRGPRFESIKEYFNSRDELMEAVAMYNHNVVKVEIIDLEESIPVYDMTVPGYSNFLISTDDIGRNGVFVHNCDADPDGKHISSLLLKFFLLYMPDMIIQGRVFKAVPPLYSIKNGKDKYTYLTDRMQYVEYVQKYFISNNTLNTVRGGKLTNKEISKILYENIDYTYDLESIANKYAIHYNLLELVIMNLDKNIKELTKIIKKEYRFMDVEVINDIPVIKGLIDGKYQTLFLNQQIISECNILLEYIKKNDSMYYMLNNNIVSLYTLMKLFENNAPKNLQRYKGLGEMNPKQLADSTLHPDSNRTLIQYTIESATEEIEMMRYLESNKTDLIKDIKVSRLDIMG